MAARIIGLPSLILAASLISRTQAQYPCKEDEGWLAKEDAQCSGTDQTSCTETLCCEERTCASVSSTTGLACPTGTAANENPETIALSGCNGKSGNDEIACVAQLCCKEMTCENIGDALNLACPTGTANAQPEDIDITDPGAWYSTCCDVTTTCQDVNDDCSSSDYECSCPNGYNTDFRDGDSDTRFNDQLGSGTVAEKFKEQCCELITCDDEGSCPEGKNVIEGQGYVDASSAGYQAQCCRWFTCSEAATEEESFVCDAGYEPSPSIQWSTGDADAFKETCCVLMSCQAVASAQGVECDDDDTFKPDQYDSSGEGDFDEEAFKTKCCGPEFKCEDYKEASGLIDGGLRTTYPGIVAAALVGAVVSWGSWAAGSAAS